jgi:hypothetical protein
MEQETIPETWQITRDDLKDLGLQSDGSYLSTNDGIVRYVITSGPYYGRRCEFNTITKTWNIEK